MNFMLPLDGVSTPLKALAGSVPVDVVRCAGPACELSRGGMLRELWSMTVTVVTPEGPELAMMGEEKMSELAGELELLAGTLS